MAAYYWVNGIVQLLDAGSEERLRERLLHITLEPIDAPEGKDGAHWFAVGLEEVWDTEFEAFRTDGAKEILYIDADCASECSGEDAESKLCILGGEIIECPNTGASSEEQELLRRCAQERGVAAMYFYIDDSDPAVNRHEGWNVGVIQNTGHETEPVAQTWHYGAASVTDGVAQLLEGPRVWRGV